MRFNLGKCLSVAILLMGLWIMNNKGHEIEGLLIILLSVGISATGKIVRAIEELPIKTETLRIKQELLKGKK